MQTINERVREQCEAGKLISYLILIAFAYFNLIKNGLQKHMTEERNKIEFLYKL